MITLTATQQSILESARKRVTWLFDVTDEAGATTYYWSTKAVIFGGQAYAFKVIPAGFKGVDMSRAKSVLGLQSPATTSFDVTDVAGGLSALDFVGGRVLVRLIMSDYTNEEVIRSWLMTIKNCSAAYRILSFECEDILQAVLEGHYPNTRLVSDLWPTVDDQQDGRCVPVVFGTAFVPLRSVYIAADDERFYVLGPSGPTYTIEKLRSPKELGHKGEWSSADYTFLQATKTDGAGDSWRVFQPVIAKSHPSLHEPDAAGVWAQGPRVLDVPVNLSRNDTAAMTDPGDVIEFVLKDMGVASGDLDSTSFAAASATYAGWGLEWNGGLFDVDERERVVAMLCAMCHSTLDVTDKIELRVLSKVSQATLSAAVVVKNSFKVSGAGRRQADSAYVEWQEADEPQDMLRKTLVSVVGGTTGRPDSAVISVPFVQDDDHVQRLGVLGHQRRLLKAGEVSMTCFSGAPGVYVAALQPDDVVTVDGALYGGTYECLVERVGVRRDASISLTLMVLR
jgi:hypothetical protein